MNLSEQLELIDGTEAMISQCLNVVKTHDEIVIFGAGVGGAALYKLLKRNNLENHIKSWSDNNVLKHYQSYMQEKLAIIPPEEIIKKFNKDICILVASSTFDLIKNQLIGYGLREDNIYLFNFAFMDLEYTDFEFIKDHISDFERAYQRMEDKKSQEIFVNILNYKITKNEKYLTTLQNYVDDEKNQYFDSGMLEFLSNERFLDIGAYTGDTFETFDKIYRDNWEHYYGLEADGKIYRKLAETLKKSQKEEKCSIYNVAAWDSDTTLYFESNAGSSTVSNHQTELQMIVSAKKVDELLEHEKVTFVKMDIEGAEMNALRGMRKLIEENKPVLAICVYHLRDDYYKITDFIESILPKEYTFYMRQYRYTPTETVCYGVPKNRLKAN